jgi:uracil-DNA glycosylase
MVSTDDGDARAELADLVGALRAAIAGRVRAGAWGVSARPSPAAPAADGAPGTGPAPAAAPAEAPAAGAAIPARAGGPSLAQIREEVGDCQRCKLAGKRTTIVFGVGSEEAPLMFVGEAPGADEDRLGEPFVGKAGQLLDRMIEAMGWTRATVYIANTLMCRPPGNRNPEPDETAACQPFLHAKLAAIRPRVIVALGRPAANLLLGTDAPISALRGRFHEYRGTRLMPTFHPAYLLRQPDRKRDAWHDLKLVIAELERLGVRSPHPPRG